MIRKNIVWIKPLTDKCRDCGSKVTDHHWFCNDCWTNHTENKKKNEEWSIFKSRCKNKIKRMRKMLKVMELDYEQICKVKLAEEIK